YVFGGADLDRKPLDSLFKLDLTSLDWAALSPAGPGPSARSGATLIVLPDGIGLLLFGGTGRDGPLADLWELRLGG
ncbi:MAG: kelch repeat-containing protein, partial [Candidatus Limnocylindrales bacterium]